MKRPFLLELFLSLILLLGTCYAAEFRQFDRSTGFFSPSDRIYAFLFNDKDFKFVVLDERDMTQPHFGTLEEAMKRTNCVAGVNGCFFGAAPQGPPLGLVIQNSRQIAPFASGSFTVAGVIYDNGRCISMMRSKQYAGLKSKVSPINALQGGPFLVERGKAITGLNAEKSTNRTFVATDGKGNWCIAMTSSLTLAELANWLATPKALGDFNIFLALNLDGGTSSAFWCQSPRVSLPSMKRVRNYLGVAPR